MKRPVLLGGLLLALGTVVEAARPQVPSDIDDLLQRVGNRVAEFYDRAKTVVCIETSTVQPIDSGYSPQGFARTVESELRVEFDRDEQDANPSVIRRIRKVNGRAPREEDKTERAGCTDPNPLAPDALAFLLPAERSAYRFRLGGMTKDRNRAAILIDFASVNRKNNLLLIEDPGGRDDCFDWTGSSTSRGRIWVDAGTHDVLRLERGVPGLVNVRVPALIQRRYRMENWVVIVRDDLEIRYKTVAFDDPAEMLLLPESITSLTLVRGGLQSTRRTQTFSDYKRFVADGRVLD